MNRQIIVFFLSPYPYSVDLRFFSPVFHPKISKGNTKTSLNDSYSNFDYKTDEKTMQDEALVYLLLDELKSQHLDDPIYQLQMRKNISHLLLILLPLVLAEIVPLHKPIVNQIFQENKQYIIYVHGNNHNFQTQSIFYSYCYGDKLCAVLDPSIPEYNQLIQYVGNTANQYLLILDSIEKRKYVLNLDDIKLTNEDLLNFEYRFINKELEPFFASEPLPNNRNEKCSKLVGKNVGEFLRRKERVKVILLYNLNQHCPSCQRVLRVFIPYAQANYDQTLVTFGYFNTFLNDHPVIHDEKTPHFLIFVDQQYQSPFEMQANDLDNLSFFLQKMLNRSFEMPVPMTDEETSDPTEVL